MAHKQQQPSAKDVQNALQARASAEKARASEWFFKTEKGQYGEHEKFRGVVMPDQRKIAKQFKALSLSENEKLMKSQWHEDRLTGLVILTEQMAKADVAMQQKIYDFYLAQVKAGRVNNWDLVDASSHKIMGPYLIDKARDDLYELADSGDLWQERTAVITNYYFIKRHDFGDILKLAEHFLTHKHDLMHKAVGWMLRELGKQDITVEKDFLDTHYKKMPRTMLRYAIERFPETERQAYLKGEK